MNIEIPFSYIGGEHLVAIPVTVGDSTQARFIFDTGIGLNIVFRRSCEELECTLSGEKYSARRMSGQIITCELGALRTIKVGSARKEKITVGILDMTLPLGLSEIKGILSLNFFEDDPFTLNYDSQSLVIEDTVSLRRRIEHGIQVPISVKRDGPSTDIFVDLMLPNRKMINVEVDTGSDILILNEELMEELGVRKDSNSVKKVEGEDETGNSFTRFFSKISGPVALRNESIFQTDPEAIFQKIVHQGLVGHSFLKGQHIVTFDLSGSRIIFSHDKNQKTA
jgi:hypothetical protein